jgi:hypothetical protein
MNVEVIIWLSIVTAILVYANVNLWADVIRRHRHRD